MNITLFEESRDSFLDTIDTATYVNLDRVTDIYNSLLDSIHKPLKLILLYGKPGTGKSMFLNKLYYDLLVNDKVVLYKTPIMDGDLFFNILAEDIYDINEEKAINFTKFIKIIEQVNFKRVPIVLLDEAQLYSYDMFEKIRLISDTKKIKFILSLHKTDKEHLIAQEHFKTRIWKSYELKNATKNEIQIYIQKKLMLANCFDTASMFKSDAIKLIYSITKGNYRDTNKLLYSVFEIYAQYAQNYELSKFNKNKISTKIIEMAAIYTGFIDA